MRSKRNFLPQAHQLATEWANVFGLFSSNAERARAVNIFRSLLTGKEEQSVRAYSMSQIKRTMRVMQIAVERAQSDPSFQFEVFSPGAVTWCIKDVLAGKPLGKRIRVEANRPLTMFNQVEGQGETSESAFVLITSGAGR